ncbi:MAG: phosphatase PAP2 family protein [Sphingomonadaceae bacterium]|nr:phosphatase PAP2 family protein [Sphingomonadaceae bacterium]
MKIARLRIAVIQAAAAFAIAASPAHADEKDWANASDIARNGLVLAALGVPIAKGDKEGALQAGGSLAISKAESWALKEVIRERRPDGSDYKSFPSGHTTVSFAAAATLHNRYGWKAGVPAYLAAGFVGVARVKADKHHWHDVLVGAALGEATGLLITSKRDSSVQLVPWAEHGGGGITFAARF